MYLYGLVRKTCKYVMIHTTLFGFYYIKWVFDFLWLFPWNPPWLVMFRTPWHPKKVYGRLRVVLKLIRRFLYKLVTKKPSFEHYKYLLTLFAKRGKLSGFWVIFGQRFRKCLPRRSRGRKRGLKRVYNEGDMIFRSLTTKSYFQKIRLLLGNFIGQKWVV